MSRLTKIVAVAVVGLGALGCTSGAAYVGVYGPPVYGPGPWGPYGGPYGPYGPYGYPPGGVWVGVPVCCDEEEQEDGVPYADPAAGSAVPDPEPRVEETGGEGGQGGQGGEVRDQHQRKGDR